MINERIYLREDKTSYIDPYLLNPQISGLTRVKRPALIILPGGAYLYKAYREGEPVAMQFGAMGYQTFVLSYPTLWPKKYYKKEEITELNPLHPYPAQVVDVYKAIKIIRENAEEWGIDPDQIYVLGFSAGGHVAASTAVNWQNLNYLEMAGIDDPEISKPNAAVLCYPMVDAELIRDRAGGGGPIPEEFLLEGPYMLQSVFGTFEPTEEMWDEMFLMDRINSDTPPFFVWHTTEDAVTPPSQTTLFVETLLKNRVMCEYHLFATGHHGMSLSSPAVATTPGDYNLNNAIWPVLADLFLKRLSPQENIFNVE